VTTQPASNPYQKLPEKTSSSPTAELVRGSTLVPPPTSPLLRAPPEQNSLGLLRGNLRLPVNACASKKKKGEEKMFTSAESIDRHHNVA
jgi:hypothetical protein